MVCIFLLVGEDVSDVIIAAPGNVDQFAHSIEINAVHTLDGGKVRYLLAGLRIHGNHLRGGARADKQPVVFFVKGSVAVPLTPGTPRGHDVAFLRIHTLTYAFASDEAEPALTHFTHQ